MSQVNTYYFDGNGGISDPDNVWSSPENAFDGDMETSASTSAVGSDTSGFLEGIGTNAPGSGADITQVRSRIRCSNSPTGGRTEYQVYSNGTSLVTYDFAPGSTPTWSDYATIGAPAGGWTWQRVQDLTTKTYNIESGTVGVNQVELEVTSIEPGNLLKTYNGTSWVNSSTLAEDGGFSYGLARVE